MDVAASLKRISCAFWTDNLSVAYVGTRK